MTDHRAGAEPNDAAALIRAALGESEAGNLSGLLRRISERMDAHGCVLWEVVPPADAEATSADGRLYVLAAYFPTEVHCASHDLSLASSDTGRAILEYEPMIVNSLRGVGGESRDPFLALSESMISMPIRFLDGSRGALNVYRKDRSFVASEVWRFRDLADLLPMLYKAIRNGVGSGLIGAVNELLHEAETRSAGILLDKDKKKTVLTRICERVAETFRCREVSIYLFDCREISVYLIDQSLEVIRYELMASTLDEGSRSKKTEYTADASDGLTGWVLKNGKPVWIFDLSHYDRDQSWINSRYPGLAWKNFIDIKEVTRRVLELGPDDPMPPLCALAMPILIGGKVIGAIRCSIAQGPYYFSTRDFDLLQLVAAQIAQCWSTWLSRREKELENTSWSRLIHLINHLNDFVQKEVDKTDSSEDRIYGEATDHIASVIEEAELNSVRLVDPKNRDIYFSAIRGPRWDPIYWSRLKQLRLRANEPGRRSSAAEHVIQTGEVYLITDTGINPFYKTIFDEEFGKVRRMILAPIKGESQFYGVLGLRGFGDVPFPKHAVKVAEMVGLQLGLYHRLATTIRKLKAEQKWQVQIWADISHQLKGPVNQAKRRSELAIEALGGDKSPFLPVRGLCRKAQHVVANLGMIADLARGKDIRPNCSVFSYSSLIKMLIEASQDTELMIDPRRQIRFNVSRESFLWPMVLDKIRIELDPDLLEQAVNNVFDNAAKYSYESTIVEILGSQSDGMFYITVRNVGLPIRGEETRLCLLREWRGRRARMTTQEGSGIGLWIVDNIMRVHGGRLIVLPTTAESQTEVKLGFPFSR